MLAHVNLPSNYSEQVVGETGQDAGSFSTGKKVFRILTPDMVTPVTRWIFFFVVE